MESKKLTIQDSSLSFLVGFLLCQIGAVIGTCIALIVYKLCNFNTSDFFSFLNTGIGYMITALSLYLVMLGVFFFFNKKTDEKIASKPNVKKCLLYLLIAIASFFSLYPIIVCIDSLLIKCGVSISTLSYSLTTKNYFISLLSLVIAPAVCEELLFRGIIFKGLKSHGKAFSIIITSIMFSLFHMSLSQTVYPLLMGLLLSVIMYYENNIYYCIIAHLTNNFLSLTLSYAKINLIFNHWTYILLAIILCVIFLAIVLTFTFKNNKQIEKQKLSKSNLVYLCVSLAIVFIIWIIVNLTA